MTNHDDAPPVPDDRDDHRPYVVGIGASAGGIEALQEFFHHVPPDSGTAYVVILHLSPDHDSQLARGAAAAAPIPVTQVAGQAAIQANHVYVVPPNRMLRIEGNTIVVADITRTGRTARAGRHVLPIARRRAVAHAPRPSSCREPDPTGRQG